MLLYISLTLIVLGILVIVGSLFLEKKGVGESIEPALDYGKPSAVPTAREHGPEDPREVARLYAESPSGNGGASFMPGPDELQTAPAASNDGPALRPEQASAAEAVLFEDRSALIDFENGLALDDNPGLYKNLKRIGSGSIIVERDGINFTVGKKLFRFDFFRIDKFIQGDRHLVLRVKGGESVKLFLFSEKELPAEIFRKYKQFARI